MNRLNRIEGQIRGLKNMLENDAYCADILTQAAAASSALAGFNRELMVSHMNSCVCEDIRQGKKETVEEFTVLLRKLMK